MKKSVAITLVAMLVAVLSFGCQSKNKDSELSETAQASIGGTELTQNTNPEAKTSETTATKDNPEDFYYGDLKPAAFKAQDLDGKEVKLCDFAGKTIVLSLGNSWCSDCQHELPILQKLHDQYKDNPNFMVMPTFLVDGERETLDTVKEFVAKNNFTMPIFVGDRKELRENFKVSRIPTLMIIAQDGNCMELAKDDQGNSRYYIIESVKEQDVVDAVAKALAEAGQVPAK